MSSLVFADRNPSRASTGTQVKIEIVREQSRRAKEDEPQLAPKQAQETLINTFASCMGVLNTFVEQRLANSMIKAHPPFAERNRAASSSAVLSSSVVVIFRGTQSKTIPSSHAAVYGTFREAET